MAFSIWRAPSFRSSRARGVYRSRLESMPGFECRRRRMTAAGQWGRVIPHHMSGILWTGWAFGCTIVGHGRSAMPAGGRLCLRSLPPKPISEDKGEV